MSAAMGTSLTPIITSAWLISLFTSSPWAWYSASENARISEDSTITSASGWLFNRVLQAVGVSTTRRSGGDFRSLITANVLAIAEIICTKIAGF